MLKFLLLIIAISCASAYMLDTDEYKANRDNMLRFSDTFAAAFHGEYLNFTSTGFRSQKLDAMLKMIKIPTEFARVEIDDWQPETAIMSCLACRSSIGLLLQQYRSGARTKEQTLEDAVGLCMQLTTYGIEVCTGVVWINGVRKIYEFLKTLIKFL